MAENCVEMKWNPFSKLTTVTLACLVGLKDACITGCVIEMYQDSHIGKTPPTPLVWLQPMRATALQWTAPSFGLYRCSVEFGCPKWWDKVRLQLYRKVMEQRPTRGDGLRERKVSLSSHTPAATLLNYLRAPSSCSMILCI